jgi:hypothetical protein
VGKEQGREPPAYSEGAFPSLPQVTCTAQAQGTQWEPLEQGVRVGATCRGHYHSVLYPETQPSPINEE